ncbi:MAG: polysaccharide deacetylase family protein, partial [Gemmatimonadota bacterium]
QRVKRALESLVVRSGGAALSRRALRGRALVLAYHNIVPTDRRACGDLSLHLPRTEFAAQLDVLQRTHEVVELAELFDGTSVQRRHPRVAITFDDAYAGAVTAGVEELRQRGLPATIFVAPHILNGRAFWWDALSGPEGLRPELREHALWSCRGEDGAVRRWAEETGQRLSIPADHATGATEVQLETAMRYNRLTLASHTWSHPNLSALDPDQLRIELTRPRVWLAERFARVLDWISYPYGLANETVEHATANAGYVAGLRVSGGWMARGFRRSYALPRMNVPAGVSLDGFALRLSGLGRE